MRTKNSLQQVAEQQLFDAQTTGTGWVCFGADGSVTNVDPEAMRAAVEGMPVEVLRMQAHSVFDRIWKERHLSRSEAYAWLGSRLGLKKRDTHIALFDAAQCRETIRLADRFMNAR